MKTTLPWYSSLQLLPSYIHDPWFNRSHLPNHATLSLVMMQLGMSLTRLGETEYMVPGKCRLMVTTQSVGE